MDSFCVKVLKSVLLLPFMAGTYRRRQNGSRYYDCAISSRVLFLVVIAIIIVLTASKDIQTGADVRLGFVVFLLAALIVCGTLGCFVIGFLAYKHGLQHVVVRQDGNSSKHRVIFLWIFAIASGFLCSFILGKEIECLMDNIGGFYFDSFVFYTIVLLVGLCTQTIFLTYFSTYKLRYSTVVYYAMLMLLAANMSVLFHIIITKNCLFVTYLHITHDINITSCFANNTIMSILIEKSRKTLSPATTEYCLLSITIILEIWSPTKVHHHPNVVQNPEMSDTQTSENLPNVIQYSEMSDTQTSENTHLLQDVTEIVPAHSRTRCRRNLGHILTVTLSLTMGLGLLICIAAIALHKEDVTQLQNVAEICELTWKSLLILAILLGFVCLEHYCSHDEAPKPFKTSEYVYLFSACCMIMLHICEALAGGITSTMVYSSLLNTSIVSIFQDYLQVVFLLHANRCRKSCARSQITPLDSVLIFITVSNFIFWFSDSFFISEYKNVQVFQQEQFSKGVLGLANQVLLPVSVFFRFTSFFEYAATYKKHIS